MDELLPAPPDQQLYDEVHARIALAKPGDDVLCPPGTLLSYWHGGMVLCWNERPMRLTF